MGAVRGACRCTHPPRCPGAGRAGSWPDRKTPLDLRVEAVASAYLCTYARRALRRLLMKTRWLRTTLALSSLALLGPVPLLAQTQFASFTGIVTSKDGNPLPNVELVATNVATQVTYTARSNEAGLYTISALPIGTYKRRPQ